jgi:hypothetical protein
MRPAINSLLAGCMLLSVTMASAVAQGKRVLGVELGSRLVLPKCGGGGALTSQPCINNDPIEHTAWGADAYHVALPISGAPSYVRGELKVVTFEGIVESVQIGTWGIQSQTGVLAALTSQYGKPARTRQQKHPLSREPAQFAEWDLADFSVTLRGTTGSIDWGLIDVSTHRYQKLVKDYVQRQPAGTSPKP